MKIFKTIVVLFALYMILPTISFAEEEMARIPAEGASITGYVGCPATSLPTPCAAESVKTTTIDAFMMDIHEVTKGELDACFNAGKCTEKDVKFALDSMKVSENWKNEPAHVNYNQAVEYCNAYGKRLPTPEEWLAAAMNNTVKKYTWGDKLERTAAAILTFNAPTTEPVMSYPKDFSQGVYDLSGSEIEWVDSPLLGEFDENAKCGDNRTRTCMGSLNYPLYQELACEALSHLRGFRCVKNAK